MNKKLILKLIFILIILWILLIVLDCYRLEHTGDTPIITIFVKDYEKIKSMEIPNGYFEEKEKGTIYVGLGYTKTYYNKQHFINSEPSSIAYLGYSIKLFGFIPISGREEI